MLRMLCADVLDSWGELGEKWRLNVCYCCWLVAVGLFLGSIRSLCSRVACIAVRILLNDRCRMLKGISVSKLISMV